MAHPFLRFIAQPVNLSGCTSLRALKFKYNLDPAHGGSEILTSSFTATFDALNSTPRIPFKLYLHFEDYHAQNTSTCLQLLSLLDWESLERALVKHLCRTKQVTVACQNSGRFSGYENVVRFIRDKLPDLDSDGLLDIIFFH